MASNSLFSLLRRRDARRTVPNFFEDFSSEIQTEPFEYPQNKFEHQQETNPTREVSMRQNENSELKYKETWQNAKDKVLANKRFKRLMKDLYSHQSAPVLDQSIEHPGKISFSISRKTSEIPEKRRWISHPSEGYKTHWNFFIGILLLYTATFTPFVMAFLETSNWDAWFWIDFFVDICFLVDVTWNLNTAYFNKDGTLEYSRKKIFIKYLKGWLLIDITASIPLGVIEALLLGEQETGSYNSLIRLSKLRSLPKLFRLSKVAKLLKHYKKSSVIDQVQIVLGIDQSVMRLISLVFGVLISVHVMTCFWYLTARLENFGIDTWVFREGYMNSDIFSSYLASLYWTMTTLTTIGYGDITPLTPFEKLVAICWMIAGLYFLSFTITSLSSAMSFEDTQQEDLDTKLNHIDNFCEELELENSIKLKMQKVVKLNSQYSSSIDEIDEVLDELPNTLKYEMAQKMYKQVIFKFSYFQGKDEVFIANVAPYLKPQYVPQFDMVYTEGEFAEEMYFIMSGRVSFVYGAEKSVYKIIMFPHCFGDIEIFFNISRKHNAMASLNCLFLGLSRKIAKRIQEKFPQELKEFRENCKEKFRNITSAKIEMEILKRTNEEGTLKSIDSRRFKELIDSELKSKLENLEDIEKETNKYKNLLQLTSETNEIQVKNERNTTNLTKIKDFLKDYLPKRDSSRKTTQRKKLSTVEEFNECFKE